MGDLPGHRVLLGAPGGQFSPGCKAVLADGVVHGGLCFGRAGRPAARLLSGRAAGAASVPAPAGGPGRHKVVEGRRPSRGGPAAPAPGSPRSAGPGPATRAGAANVSTSPRPYRLEF